MGWLSLIRAALEAIIAVPKVIAQILTGKINARLEALEEKVSKIDPAYKHASEAKTTEEKLNAASELYDSSNGS